MQFEKKLKWPKRVKITPAKFCNYPFTPNSQKLVLSFKECCKNPILANNDFFLLYFSSWQRVTEVDFLYQKRKTDQMALLCPLSLQTNPPDSVILSPKTKGSVIPQAEWSWSEDLANVSQGRSNVNIQSTPVEWAVRKGGGALLPCKA